MTTTNEDIARMLECSRGRRGTDSRPLLREIIALCMGMNDKGLQAARAACAGLADLYPLASTERCPALSLDSYRPRKANERRGAHQEARP